MINKNHKEVINMIEDFFITLIKFIDLIYNYPITVLSLCINSYFILNKIIDKRIEIENKKKIGE